MGSAEKSAPSVQCNLDSLPQRYEVNKDAPSPQNEDKGSRVEQDDIVAGDVEDLAEDVDADEQDSEE